MDRAHWPIDDQGVAPRTLRPPPHCGAAPSQHFRNERDRRQCCSRLRRVVPRHCARMWPAATDSTMHWACEFPIAYGGFATPPPRPFSRCDSTGCCHGTGCLPTSAPSAITIEASGVALADNDPRSRRTAGSRALQSYCAGSAFISNVKTGVGGARRRPQSCHRLPVHGVVPEFNKQNLFNAEPVQYGTLNRSAPMLKVICRLMILIACK